MHPNTFALTVDGHDAQLTFGTWFDYDTRPVLEALAMGRHARLGARSALHAVPDDVLRTLIPSSPCVSLHVPALRLALYDLNAGSQAVYLIPPKYWHLTGVIKTTLMMRVPDHQLRTHLHQTLRARSDAPTAALYEDQVYGHTLTLYSPGDEGTLRLHFGGIEFL